MTARETAVKTLIRCEQTKAYASLVLDKKLTDGGLSDVDKAFATRLVFGTLDNQIKIDYIISAFSKIKLDKMSPTVRNGIRVAVFQIFMLDKVPDSAACDEAVELVKKSKDKHAAGFVNAVIRNIIRGKDSIKLPDREKELALYLSVNYSVPLWIVELWLEQYGDVEAMLASNAEQTLSVTVNTRKISRDDFIARLTEKGFSAKAGELCERTVHLYDTGKVDKIYGFDEGLFFVQDEASAFAASLLSAEKGDTVIDLCAAPGGKTLYTAVDMDDSGRILAFDLHANKLGLLMGSAERLGLSSVSAKAGDGRAENAELLELADRAICDAPCSGLGVMAKKPEIKMKSFDEIKGLPQIQYELLSNAAKYVKKGGTLLYSTCTLNKLENEYVVKRFLQENKSFEPLSFDAPKGLRYDEETGSITLLPNVYGSDGFFAARMRKI